jgi:4-amino-4-deoxy-L-arabinose transferase-like glycosyltransferase
MGNTFNQTRQGQMLFWTAAFVLLFYKLGSTDPWQSEDRWLEIVREMMDSGNYFKPTINGQVYFDKPLLSYWLQVLVAKIHGSLDGWALRLPGAIAALVTLWATMDMGRQLWSGKTAVLAGWILLTGLGFLQWGRIAEADMENLAVTIVAVNWYWCRRDSTGFFDYLVFYLVMAVGSQFKGLTAVVVPLLAVLPDLLSQQRWRRHLRPAHLLAVIAAAAIYLLPFLLATQSTGSEITTAGHSSGLGLVIRENIVRYFAPFDHTGPIYTYLVTLPEFVFPWSPVLAAALLACCRKNFRHQANVAWVLWVFLLILVFFSVSGSRRSYYILPILPYSALLTARFLQDLQFSRMRQASLLISIALLLIASSLEATLPWFWPALEHHTGITLPAELKWISCATGCSVLCFLLASFLWSRKRGESLFIPVTGGALILWSGLFFWQQPAVDHYRTEVPFARGLERLAAGMTATQTAIYRSQPSGRLLFYSALPVPVQQVDNPAQLQAFIESAPYPKLLLVHVKDKSDLPLSLRNRVPDLAEKQYGWEKDTGDKLLAWHIDSSAVNPPSP